MKDDGLGCLLSLHLMVMDQWLVLLDEGIGLVEVFLQLSDSLEESGAVLNGIHLREEGGGSIAQDVRGLTRQTEKRTAKQSSRR